MVHVKAAVGTVEVFLGVFFAWGGGVDPFGEFVEWISVEDGLYCSGLEDWHEVGWVGDVFVPAAVGVGLWCLCFLCFDGVAVNVAQEGVEVGFVVDGFGL